jgi:hypothetical protein
LSISGRKIWYQRNNRLPNLETKWIWYKRGVFLFTDRREHKTKPSKRRTEVSKHTDPQPFYQNKKKHFGFPPSSTEPLTRSPLEDSLTVLLLVQSVLEVMRFVLAGMAIVTSLAGVRPGNLVIQIGLHVRMSISLKFDSIGNHQTLRDRNDILNKAIA